MLPYEPVHGDLERAGHAARRCLSHTWRMGQVLGDLVRERAPEPRTGSAWLGPIYSQFVYSKLMSFNVFDEFWGVKNGWHGDTPCLRMLPIGYGGCLLRSSQYRGTGAASGEGQSSISCFIISERKYRSWHIKRKTNCFHKNEKK